MAAAPGGGGLLSGLRVPTQLLALHVNQQLGGRGSVGPSSQVGENRQSEVPRESFSLPACHRRGVEERSGDGADVLLEMGTG